MLGVADHSPSFSLPRKIYSNFTLCIRISSHQLIPLIYIVYPKTLQSCYSRTFIIGQNTHRKDL